MNKLDKAYTDLLQDILDTGTTKMDRTGTGTISVFGRQIRHNMKDGFPLLTTKKMPFKTIVTELLWFLRGDTNIKYLVDNNCNIWTGDAYKRYADSHNTFIGGFVHVTPMAHSKESFIEAIKTDDEFAKKWGELGPVYGKQWRKWREGKYTNELIVDGLDIPDGPTYWKEGIDQIANLINDLKTNPDSRRLMVNAWNVGELNSMVLPPCHYGFQVYTRELNQEERWRIRYNYYPKDKQFPWDRMALPPHDFLDKFNIPRRAISLMYNARSQDVPLGTPFNISSYALLLVIIGKIVNMIPEELITNMGDCHIYLNQIDGVKEQIGRESFDLPTVELSDRIVGDISEYTMDDIKLLNYVSHPKIYFPLSN